ncbi:hypothetical protein SAMN05421803_14320 [Nocardiopsis flavescens]|uniref:Uncharacterized protein n=1 Tax=Nocardiopsis flavescens TaxID=758803 RepID=A0A1M6WG15_9ACTN|nr:hypothetical protein [Nocardiopsis flavescens]SHK92618.1 hypothetical protein SAMN05421803_14320 [Nocardiopsis flavescens]
MASQDNSTGNVTDSTAAQLRDNHGILTLGGTATFSGTTVVGDNANVTITNGDEKK